MKTIIVKIEDDLAKELEQYPNMSDVVRQSLRFYIEHISTDTLAGMRASYTRIAKALTELDSKVDFIAKRVQ